MNCVRVGNGPSPAMTDSAFATSSKASSVGNAVPFRDELRHIRTKPYTPKINRKAERVIQTSLREWAYARAYNTSDERQPHLPRGLHRSNGHRLRPVSGQSHPSADSLLLGTAY